MAIMTPIRILIADDHLVFRIGLKTLLQAEPDMEVVAEAESGEECISAYQIQRPSIVLMDLRMGELSGIDAVSAIRRKDPSAKILMLTSYGSEEDIYQSIQKGAQGYVIKDVNRTELTQAIRSVAQGRKWLPAAVAARLADRLPRAQLTPRELEILQLLARGLINREIAHILCVSQSTIKNQINIMFAKLEVTDRTEAVTAALQRGVLRLDT